MNRDKFFDSLWKQYISVTPQARGIQSLLLRHGEEVTNDHVAFRTFDIQGFGLEMVTELVAEIGYERFDSYVFPDKHLRAHAYWVPNEHDVPKIFFSELVCAELDSDSQSIIAEITSPLTGELTLKDLVGAYLFKRPTLEQYSRLCDASEYAGWLSTMGYQANHFTVNVNGLRTLDSIDGLIDLLVANQYPLNDVGGVIKGTNSDLLVQASTLADTIRFEFEDGFESDIPSCFYEFAYRFTDSTGQPFQGFIPNSANAIFESTDRQA
ncbi:MAG TPA: DUF1338 domain-containing protein [Gammaproteobacteria bacterium]|nr:succinyldiaminopimelate aminotransferase [Gammaproteobacteria bacterium]HBX26590.1 DUF1338 domain-containing protein [Gammaproteobacteria bacterium]